MASTGRQPKQIGYTTIYTRGLVNKRILKIKAPFWAAIHTLTTDSNAVEKIHAAIKLLKLVPEIRELPLPTKENTRWRNTDVLIDLRDRFFEFENNGNREPVFRAVWDFLIILYDYDPYYQERIDAIFDWWLGYWQQGLWEPREPNRPKPPVWREFDPQYKNK